MPAEGTKPAVLTVPDDGLAAAVAALPLPVRVGQLLLAGITETVAGPDARYLLDELRIGNIILMGRNFETPAQVRALTTDLQALAAGATGLPLLIGTDQEGGQVQRADWEDGFTPLPPAALAGEVTDIALLHAYGALIGGELAAVGVNLNVAPVLDAASNPANPAVARRGRCFGAEPATVIAAALPVAAGLASAGVIAAGKHFPGHGMTAVDSHDGVPIAALSRAELAPALAPFAAAITAGMPALMPAHVIYPALDPDRPATLSPRVLGDLLRDELGFTGVVLWDDVGMPGLVAGGNPATVAPRAIAAGVDLLTCVRLVMPCSCPPEAIAGIRQALLAAVEQGELPVSRVNEAVTRVLRLKRRLPGPDAQPDLAVVQSPTHLALIGEIFAAVAGRRAAGRTLR